MKRILNYFSKSEIILWLLEVIIIITFFCIFDRKEFLNLAASLIGITALIFCAKGNPIGQALVIVFSALYGIIAFGFAYYGEMLTYLGMTTPMAIISLISWVKNPSGENSSEVKIRSLKKNRYNNYATFYDCGNDYILFYSQKIRYGKSSNKHNICYNKLCGGISRL